MRKLLSAFLILILLLAILAGCGVGETAAVDIAQSPEPTGHIAPGDSPAPEDARTGDTEGLGDTVLNAWVEPDSRFYPYYYLLDDAERKAYALLYTGMMSGEETISMGGFVETDEIVDVFIAVKKDHPEIFWVDLEFDHRSINDAVWSILPVYNAHAAYLPGSQARFDAAVSDIVDAAAGMSDVEKERYVHDWLAEHVVYDMEAFDAQNAYSAIVDGRAVCAGYAMAFQYLMHRLNVPCWFCEGQSLDPESDQEKHAWNIVVLDGEPYNVDVTWDDFEDADLSFIYYGYYNVPDTVILEENMRMDSSASLPGCTATDLSFEGIYGTTVRQAVYDAVMEEKGIHALISSREDFISRVKEALVSRGEGEYPLHFLMAGYGVSDEIDQALSAKELDESIFYAAAEELGLNGFSYGYAWQIITYDVSECPIILFTITPSLYSA